MGAPDAVPSIATSANSATHNASSVPNTQNATTNPKPPSTSSPTQSSSSAPSTPIVNATKPGVQISLPVRFDPQVVQSSKSNTKKRTNSGFYWRRSKNAFTPTSHEFRNDEKLTRTDLVRPYKRYRQWRRLSFLTGFELFMTMVLCAFLGCTLYWYSGYPVLSKREKHIFNSIITGLSIALGLNVAGSLKSYAKILRWRFLASEFRTLEQFEQIMGSDQLINIFALLWSARRQSQKTPWLVIWPTVTQLVCLTWILINIASAILVAMLGLTYNLNQSSTAVNSATGNKSVVMLSPLADIYADTSNTTYYSELGAAHTFGLEGGGFNTIWEIGPQNFSDLYRGYQDVNVDPNNSGYAEYWFMDVNSNSDNPHDESDISGRYLNVTVRCTQYPIVVGGSGNTAYIGYTAEDGHMVTEYVGTASDAGTTTYISDTNSTCGPRCTNVKVFQPATNTTADGQNNDNFDAFGGATNATFTVCNSTMGTVVLNAIPDYGKVQAPNSAFDLPDLQARMLAGAIGFTGVAFANQSITSELSTYNQGNSFAPSDSIDVDGAQFNIAWFAMAAVAAMDYGGNHVNITADDVPIYGDQLQIDHWWRVGALLGGITALQAISMVSVIIWGSKVIIKDETFISMAKLFKNVIEDPKLGMDDHGCLLRGKEIMERWGAGQDDKVIYSWKDGVQTAPDGSAEDVMHVDIFRHTDCGDPTRRFEKFPEGMYDGMESRSRPQRQKLKIE